MANLRIELTELELLQIIGKHIREEYGLGSKHQLTIGWEGNSPSGAIVTSNPPMESAAPTKNLFEED